MPQQYTIVLPEIMMILIKIISISAMLIGSIGVIKQISLKRLMGYSTLLNIGCALIGVAVNSDQGSGAALLYIITYAATFFGVFACLIALFGIKINKDTFSDISGIAYNKKALAGAIAILMFSMIGIPPLAGFFSKYYILYQAILHEEFILAFIAIITNIIAAFSYFKVIRSMYFQDVVTSIAYIPTNRSLLFITSLIIGFILFFGLFAQKIFALI